MPVIKFGTDGWRALMSQEFTFENVELVAQAYCDHINVSGVKKPARIVVGYDFRENSENFAKTVAQILCANGIEVILSSAACPTPAVSFTIVDQKLDSGIIITASHNPAAYNGIKIKTNYGGSADRGITDAVEKLIGKNPVKKKKFDAQNPRLLNLNEKYLKFLGGYLKLDAIKASPYRILVDSMHGTGARHIETLLAGGKIKIKTIHADRDPKFGGVAPEPILKNLGEAAKLMSGGDFDLCVVTDGDSDRVGTIRPGGEFVSPGVVLSLILLHFVEDLKKTGSVVTTISNTGLIYRVAKKLGLKVHETPVGFKYICEIMLKESVLIGGEESGGIAFQNYLFERDGLLSALLLMQMMAVRKQSFEEILSGVEKEFGKLYYVRNDMGYPNELKPKLFQTLSVKPPQNFAGQHVKDINAVDGTKFILDDGSWLLFRLSGTEPILRVYSEATSEKLAQTLVQQGKEFALSIS